MSLVVFELPHSLLLAGLHVKSMAYLRFISVTRVSNTTIEDLSVHQDCAFFDQYLGLAFCRMKNNVIKYALRSWEENER